MTAPEIIFPNFGINIPHLDKTAFRLIGIDVRWYGIMLGLGVLLGGAAAVTTARRTGQKPQLYYDFAFFAVIAGVIGARLYYVIFSWNEYKSDLLKIFDIRSGGLAIYGTVLAAVLTAFIYARVKKISFWLLADTGAVGLILGQAVGRWGNFFNKEAFGGYTNSFLKMGLLKGGDIGGVVTRQMLDNLYTGPNGGEYVLVHPTFLYESLWCFAVFAFLFLYTKRKRFDGEVFFLYLLLYGLGRVFIEALRTDQLKLFGTGMAVSQLLSALLVILALGAIIYKGVSLKKIKKSE